MPLFSFVIPVYKVEDYLHECVYSILNQTYTDFEMILVDDGSPDSCPQICDDLSKEDSRIRVIHKKNEGLSVARNTGLLEATGEYIIFVDSDDYWCAKEALKKISDILEKDKVDIVAFASKTYYENNNTFEDDRYNYPSEMNTLNPKEALKYMISHDLFNVHAAKRTFKKSFLIDNELFYKPGIRAEDIEMYIRCSNCLPSYKFLNEKVYVYRKREGSITTTVDGTHLSEHLETIESFINYPFLNDEIKEYMYSYLAYSLSVVLAHVECVKPDNYKELMKRIKKCCFLFNYTLYPRTKQVSLFYKIFGFKLTGKALGIFLGKRM